MKTIFSRRSLILSLAILLTACGGTAATDPTPPALQQEMLDVLSQKSPDMTLHGQATGPLVKCDTIPVAHTPAGGYIEYPELVLKDCNEPLAPGAPDISGLWVQYTGGDSIDHMERIEQAGNRIVITGNGVIHDAVADGTVENGVNDISATDFKSEVHVAAVFELGGMSYYPLGGPIAYATRRLEGDVLVINWGTKTLRMERVPYSLLPWLLTHGGDFKGVK